VAIPGSCIEYLITVENTGDGIARSIALTDILSPNFIYRGGQVSGFITTEPGYAASFPSPGTDCGVSSCAVELEEARLNGGQTGTIRVRVELK
jgi:uncharacterized repeat protein (TIGR01451 family)